MIKKHFKKLVGLALSIVMVLGMPITAFAAEQPIPTPPVNSDGVIEITEEYITQYGIHSVDELGNEIIEIPLGPDLSNISEPFITNEPSSCNESVHEGHSYPEDLIQTYHFSLIPHSHTIINLRSMQYSNTIPITSYAAAGFTISKEYSKSVEITLSSNLNGGITLEAVELELGFSYSATCTRGEAESYTATVPSGYRGRIAYRYYSTLYLFDNKTKYLWSEEIDACSIESEPYDGYFYLQLLSIN